MSLTLVTGATGVVGRYVADALLAQGDRVRIVSRRSPKPWHANLEIIEGDLRHEGVIQRPFSIKIKDIQCIQSISPFLQ